MSHQAARCFCLLHGWEGRSEAQTEIARSLAAKGYIGFSCDMFGKGIRGNITGDNTALIAPLLQDRELLRDRLVGTVRFVQSLPEVDPHRLAAIGFCFGGLCALDLARSGLDIRAVASFEHWRVSKTLAGKYVWATIDLSKKELLVYGRHSLRTKPRQIKQFAYEINEPVQSLLPEDSTGCLEFRASAYDGSLGIRVGAPYILWSFNHG